MPLWNYSIALAATLALGLCPNGSAQAQFDLQLTITNPGIYTPTQLAILQEGVDFAERLWEREILGYAPGINRTTLPITINAGTTGLGFASGSGAIRAGGFTVYTSGSVTINRLALEEFSNFRGSGVDIIGELVAHEIAHVLGIGPLWGANGVYVNNSGQYTGEFGLAAYRQEFDRDAEFIPVELAGPAGSANAHWDQLFRSSPEEGNPSDPFSLEPFVGITDVFGRDLGLELLTAAIDPDFGEPFLARFTVESLRDLGFVVRSVRIPEPSALLLAVVGLTAAGGGRHRGPHG